MGAVEGQTMGAILPLTSFVTLFAASRTGPCQETSKYALTVMAGGDAWKCLYEGIASRINWGEEVLARRDLENEEQVRGTRITCQWRGSEDASCAYSCLLFGG